MSDFNIRSESVDVEQIMRQIRTRIQEKRGADYTEEQVRELATVRLEKFLDPKNLRSDLLDQFRRSRPALPDEPPPVQAPYDFNDETLFASHRGPLRIIRKLLKPILKLFFNPNTLNQILHTQAQFNVDLLKREQRRRIEFERSRAEWNALYYEVLHNLVLETTRNGIELKNLRMRVEALSSRLDFSERRVRALEGVVQYRPEAFRSRERDRDRQRPQRVEDEAISGDGQDPALVPTGEGVPHPAQGAMSVAAGEGRRRRRRRRGRRGAGDRGPLPAGAPAGIDADSADYPDAGAVDDVGSPLTAESADYSESRSDDDAEYGDNDQVIDDAELRTTEGALGAPQFDESTPGYTASDDVREHTSSEDEVANAPGGDLPDRDRSRDGGSDPNAQ
jgi:hypothetical protein